MALGEGKIGPLFTPNFSYLSSTTGILNILQIICSGICMFLLLGHCQPAYSGSYGSFLGTAEDTFALLAHSGILTTKALFFVSCLLSMPTAAIMARTLLEFVVCCGLFCLSLVASLTFIFSFHGSLPQHEYQYNWRLTVAVASLIGCFLHFHSTWESFRTCRRASF